MLKARAAPVGERTPAFKAHKQNACLRGAVHLIGDKSPKYGVFVDICVQFRTGFGVIYKYPDF